MSGTSIPEEHVRRFREALLLKEPLLESTDELGVTVRAKVATEMRRPITYAEFQAHVKKPRKGKAPGVTGLTYEMIKALPDTHSRAVFDYMSKMYQEHYVPQWFKDRWLCPLPKKENPTVNDLRPISLLETLRKLWLGLIMRRFTKMVKEHVLLDQRQHGGINGRSCETAVLRLITNMEEARERFTQLHIAQLDIRRAFDSVSFPLRLIGWLRVGMPLDLAQYLVSVDVDANTIVHTPLAIKRIRQSRATIPEMAFSQGRGCGQGDTPSPLTWAVTHDIYLGAVSLAEVPTKWMRVDSMRLAPRDDHGYADDIPHTAESHADLQIIMDTVSATAAIMGHELSPKSTFIVLNYSDQEVRPAPIVVRDQDWEPTEIPFTESDSVKYLGVHLSKEGSQTHQIDLTVEMGRRTAAYMADRKASLASKMVVIRACLAPKLMYPLRFLAVTDKELNRLQSAMNPFFRRMSRNMHSFPNDLLLLDTKFGGLGFPEFVRLVPTAKLATLVRVASRSDSGEVILSLLYRRARSLGFDPPPECRFSFDMNIDKSVYWVDSVIEYTQAYGGALSWGGLPNTRLMDEPVQRQPLTNKQSLDFIGCSISTYADLFDSLGNPVFPEGFCGLTLPPLDRAHPNTFRSEQYYALKIPGGEYAVYQIMGLTGEGYWEVLVWYLRGAPLAPGTVMRAESPRTYKLLDMRPEEWEGCHRVISKRAVYKNGAVYRKILWAFPCSEPRRGNPPARPMHRGGTIYTDASFSREESLLSVLTGEKPISEIRASAGVYRGADLPSVRVCLNGLPVQHSFAAEAVALVVALAISGPEDDFVTDSKSIVTTIQKRSHFTTRTNSPYLEILKFQADRIRWHQAHVEKRELNRALWTPDERGNYFADKVAGLKPEPGMHIQHYSLIQLRDAIRELPGIYITGRDGLPLIEDPANYYLREKSKRYIQKRDWSREKRGAAPKWEGLDTEAVSRNHAFPRRAAESLCSDIRIIYDKTWHPGNRKKGVKGDDEEVEFVGRCVMCERQDSMLHSLLECDHHTIVEIRERMFHNIQEVQDDVDDHPVAKAILRVMREEFLNDRYPVEDERPALGAWSGRAKARMVRRLPYLRNKAFKAARVRDAARDFYRIAVEHMKQMFTAKRRQEGGRINWYREWIAPTKHPPR